MSAATSPAEVAASHGLPRLGQRPSLPGYLRQLWRRRHFGIELARSRFRAETEQDRLGVAWVVIKPLINAVVYGTVFGLLLPSDTRPDNFVAFLVIGVFLFQFFSSSLSDGAKSITGNLGLVRSLHFPRALLPLATVLQQVYALGPMVAVMCGITLVSGEPVRLTWLQVVPALALMTLFNAGIALVAGRLTIHVRDVTQLLPFLTRVMFYTSGVFFAVDQTVTQPVVRSLLQANPVHVYISLCRGALVEGLEVEPERWLVGAAWGVLTLAVGFVFFWRAEERYGRE